ncbi:hypothetical protein HOU39_gp087 [Lactobacillus phage Iacchus]|uniref:Uncharacterized protein n=2 Tax=Harbinvirus TaxID=2732970 RepID=A0A2K9VCS9_9CAUD|nr:hypothetical protein HOS78_gp086 [Lactobacillus phage Bacchae]YP_009814304.1 hypothetical protein HOU39_gp087 [Lactobacillus phage Iacchus]AUV60022.1 hypothetical protein [Lactobacillus phage Bacchae]AYH91981.1 hypothetical protein [Lactobacillus phage Iacchus]AYH92153.1 hypothetical protein [Lactobacillus phage Dionysus]
MVSFYYRKRKKDTSMSKYVIALNEDVEILDGEQYDTLDDAKGVATSILKQLSSDTSKTLDDYEDLVCEYLADEDETVDSLTILEITPACFPDFGDMILDGLADYSISEGNIDEEYPEATSKEQDELNELVTKWMTEKGYTPNWYNTESVCLVELEEK